MVKVDFIGLLLTVFFVGLRYPHYVIIAASIHEIGRLLMAVFLASHVESIVAAGAFGRMIVNDNQTGIINALLIYSGSLANYIISSMIGGIAFEPTTKLINPLAQLKSPFAVINFRLCILSFFIQMWKNMI